MKTAVMLPRAKDYRELPEAERGKVRRLWQGSESRTTLLTPQFWTSSAGLRGDEFLFSASRCTSTSALYALLSFSIWLTLICPLEVSCIPSCELRPDLQTGSGMTLGSVHLDKSTYMGPCAGSRSSGLLVTLASVGLLEGRSRPLKAPAMNWMALSLACQELPVALQRAR